MHKKRRFYRLFFIQVKCVKPLVFLDKSAILD